ncbi:MAG: hypothetical protein IJ998_03350 [Alistipes sp.]|nr:hypothetical protein [Alistipes sp.]
MEENKIQDIEPTVTESQSVQPQVATENNVEPQAQEPKAEVVAEPQTAPQSEPQAAPQTPLAPPVMVQPRRSGGIFLKVFLASLLALVAFAIVKIFFWGAIIASLFAEEPIEVPESAILRIDMKEAIADAPSRNPMGNFDITTMSITPQMTLLNALTAIDAAKSDPRIKAIYINTTGMGGALLKLQRLLRKTLKINYLCLGVYL